MHYCEILNANHGKPEYLDDSGLNFVLPNTHFITNFGPIPYSHDGTIWDLMVFLGKCVVFAARPAKAGEEANDLGCVTMEFTIPKEQAKQLVDYIRGL